MCEAKVPRTTQESSTPSMIINEEDEYEMEEVWKHRI